MDEIQQLTGIYHEIQEGSLCAQHALNNLLQKEMFSAVSLADIAREIDEHETRVLGLTTAESQNMDDTGFFSIQVLQNALRVFDIELIPYASQHAVAERARDNPQSVQAYICNLREHWLTIRRFGTQYFDLNSISTVPKLISNTYLSLYLAQLQQSGYSIFIIHGHLPHCTADERLSNTTLDPAYYRSLIERASVNTRGSSKSQKRTPSSPSFDDRDIERAIKASVDLDNADDRALQEVLAQSLRDAPSADETELFNQNLLDQAIAASLAKDASSERKKDEPPVEVTPKVEPTIEELRQRRLQFYSSQEKPKPDEQPGEPKT